VIFIYFKDSCTQKTTQFNALAGQIQHMAAKKVGVTPRLLRQVALTCRFLSSAALKSTYQSWAWSLQVRATCPWSMQKPYPLWASVSPLWQTSQRFTYKQCTSDSMGTPPLYDWKMQKPRMKHHCRLHSVLHKHGVPETPRAPRLRSPYRQHQCPFASWKRPWIVLVSVCLCVCVCVCVKGGSEMGTV